MQLDVFKVCESMLTITEKMDYMKGQSRRNNLKGSNIYIKEDFTDAVRRKGKDLIPDLRAEGPFLTYGRTN